jgi:formate/nitrite transporter FocA (FNT family)
MADSIPVPPFRHRLPADIAARIQATGVAATERRRARRMAVAVVAGALFGALYAVTVPAGEAHAMRKDCVPVVVLDLSDVPQTVENSSC